jgi:hypothetical protein
VEGRRIRCVLKEGRRIVEVEVLGEGRRIVVGVLMEKGRERPAVCVVLKEGRGIGVPEYGKRDRDVLKRVECHEG